ncbi:hypothetical protein PSP6_50235 [Paraburkholderia tropica]|nr:hypothetical protein PSP6_50235 [Paraburkholderia tropica]
MCNRPARPGRTRFQHARDPADELDAACAGHHRRSRAHPQDSADGQHGGRVVARFRRGDRRRQLRGNGSGSRSHRVGARAGDDARPRLLPQQHEELRRAVPRRAHQRGVRRQGDRHESHAADGQGRALHGRSVGRQVHQDLHVSEGAHRRGERADRLVLLASVRDRRDDRARRTGEYPRAPLRPEGRALRLGCAGVTDAIASQRTAAGLMPRLKETAGFIGAAAAPRA